MRFQRAVWAVLLSAAGCGGDDDGHPSPDGSPVVDGSVAFTNVHENQELQTGFIVGTAAGTFTEVGCQFDGGEVVIASGTTSWSCPRPTTWAIGGAHTITAGLWDGSALVSPVSVEVWNRQNHDFNGDGYPDLAIGAPFASSNRGTVSIFYGSPTGVSTEADLTLDGPEASSMFGFAFVAADLRGSGYADLAVGLASFSVALEDPGTVYFFSGERAGLPSTPSYALDGPALNAYAGGYSLAAGDYDGDDFQDLAVGYGEYDAGAGAVYFYRGDTDGATFDAMQLGVDHFGSYVALGDYFGTGYAAAAIGHGGGADPGTFFYPGGASGIAEEADGMVPEVGAIHTAFVKRAGFADLVVAGNAEATIHYGGADGPAGSTTVEDPPMFGWGTVVAGDVDADGHDDVVLANPCLDDSCVDGSALVFLGGAAGVATDSTTTLSNPGATSQFGYGLGLTDVDADGRLDLVVASNGPAVYLYLGDGSPEIFPSAPSLTITGLPDATFSTR